MLKEEEEEDTETIRNEGLLGITAGDVVDEVDDTVRVAPLVIVPRDELDKVAIEGDTSLGVKDAAATVSDKIRGDDSVLGVTQDAVEGSLRGSLDGLLDLLVGGGTLEADGEIDDRDVDGGHTEGHSSELAVFVKEKTHPTSNVQIKISIKKKKMERVERRL